MDHAARARSWAELLDQLYAESWNPEMQRFRSPFAFRGLASAAHDLSNSLIRLAGHGANDQPSQENGIPEVSKLELSLLRNFRKYAHAQAASPVDSIWHWLALGQHHGLPTRLVDWTYSPLVALHFATEHPEDFESDGLVWCVNFVEANRLLPPRLKSILEEEYSDTFTVEMLSEFPTLRAFDSLGREPFVIFMEPPSLDTRILNQFALFALMPTPAARLDHWLEAHPKLFRQVVIPADLKWEVRDKLDQANINERTLFPGLDGLSRWLERYYLPKSRQPSQP